MTKSELKSQFQNSYNRESWKPILKLVFGQINYFTDPFSLFEGVETVKQGYQIGYVDLPNNQTVAIFEIEVADSIIIERNRKGLRDIAEKFINGTFTAALVFYYSKNQTEYRFSFIAKQSKIDEQTGEYSTIVTAPKRYTYVLGTPFCATAAERWIKLAAEPEITVDKITDAFSVEKLSKEFFDQYKIQYTRFCKFIGDDSVTLKQFIDHTETDAVKAQKPLRDYVKKLLGRLVFLQFLQKKGWMGVPAANKDWKGGDLNFMANLFDKSQYKDNYLDQVLEPLFFNTLNAERTNDIAEDIDSTIKIPYLNGGLFEKTTLDDTHVKFPKHYFSELFEFFNQYNFTIDENDPDDAEVGIDPEMLGHIFENLLEDNKDKGAFYTPKEIVRYMCQESLIAYLHTHTPDALHPSVEKLIRTHKVDDCLQDKPNATLIQKLLVAVKICDPAIGSGAFPMGMLNEIFMVRRLMFGFLGKNVSFSACLVKKEIIQNNIYGVDIEQGAVDIARLRFWLALVVDEDVPQALPNLDYKIMCGNSLISRFALDAPIKDVFAEYNKKYKTNFTLQDYKNIVDEYTDTHEAKEQFRAKIEEIKGAFKSILLSSDLVTRKKIEAEVLDYELVGVFGERKADADKKGYKAAKTKLEKYLKSENDKINNKNYLNGFEWRFEFPSLLDENGNFMGFDIVIANPPYIGEKGNESIFQLVSNTSLGKRFYTRWMDYFYFFFHIGIDYLKDNGCLMVISTNYYFTSTGGNLLRKDINERTSITSLINFNELTIFESAVGQHNVITKLLKCKNDKLISYNFDVLKKGVADSTILKSILNKIDNDTQYYEVDQESIFEGLDYQIRLQGKGQIDNISSSVNDVLRKMTINSTPLGSITSITMGIVSLSDTLSDSHLRKYKIEGKKGDGIYVLNNNELANLNLTAEEKDIYIKPFYKNSDIQKFISKKSNDLWLIYSKDKGKPIILPIGIKNHFEKFKELIVGLKSNFLKNEIAASVVKKWFANNNYFVLFTPKKETYFNNDKIVAPYRCKSNNFALSTVPFYGSKDIAYILPKDRSYNLKFLVCILNSTLVYKWLYFKGKRKGEMLELYSKPLSDIPIIKIHDQSKFVLLHDEIVSLKEEGLNTLDLEQQINTLVYKLYELSYEEVLLIEPDFGQRVSVEEYEKVVVE